MVWLPFPPFPYPTSSVSPSPSTMDECLVQCKRCDLFVRVEWLFNVSIWKSKVQKCQTKYLPSHISLDYILILDIELTRFTRQSSQTTPPGLWKLPPRPRHIIITSISAWMFQCLNWRTLMFTYTYLLGWAACLANVFSSVLDFILWFSFLSPVYLVVMVGLWWLYHYPRLKKVEILI